MSSHIPVMASNLCAAAYCVLLQLLTIGCDPDMSVHTRCKPIHDTNTGCIQGLYICSNQLTIFFHAHSQTKEYFLCHKYFQTSHVRKQRERPSTLHTECFKKPSMTMKKIAGLFFKAIAITSTCRSFFMLICPH
jgi:hypothetical protein